jgi:hypothetical protein
LTPHQEHRIDPPAAGSGAVAFTPHKGQAKKIIRRHFGDRGAAHCAAGRGRIQAGSSSPACRLPVGEARQIAWDSRDPEQPSWALARWCQG